MKKTMRHLLYVLIAMFAYSGGPGALAATVDVLSPQDLQGLRLESIRAGDRIQMKTGSTGPNLYMVRTIQSDGPGTGTIEGYLLANSASEFRIDWSASGVIGLFRAANGALSVFGAGSADAVVVVVGVPTTIAAPAAHESVVERFATAASAKSGPLLSVAGLRAVLPQLLTRAIEDPSDANLAAYMYAQRLAMDHAEHLSRLCGGLGEADTEQCIAARVADAI